MRARGTTARPVRVHGTRRGGPDQRPRLRRRARRENGRSVHGPEALPRRALRLPRRSRPRELDQAPAAIDHPARGGLCRGTLAPRRSRACATSSSTPTSASTSTASGTSSRTSCPFSSAGFGRSHKAEGSVALSRRCSRIASCQRTAPLCGVGVGTPPLPTTSARPSSRERARRRLPACGRRGVAHRPQVRQRVQLRDQLLARQRVLRWLRKVRHRPEAQRVVLAGRSRPAQVRREGHRVDGALVADEQMGRPPAQPAHPNRPVAVA